MNNIFRTLTLSLALAAVSTQAEGTGVFLGTGSAGDSAGVVFDLGGTELGLRGTFFDYGPSDGISTGWAYQVDVFAHLDLARSGETSLFVEPSVAFQDSHESLGGESRIGLGLGLGIDTKIAESVKLGGQIQSSFLFKGDELPYSLNIFDGLLVHATYYF